MKKPIKPRPRPKKALPGVGGEPLHEGTSYTDPEPVSEPPEGRESVSAHAGEAVDNTPIREDDHGTLADWMCGAKLRGAREGLLCRNPKIRGGKRCRMHGSATFKAREKAKETILLASYPAAKKVQEIMDDPDAPFGVKLAAAKDLLDRADVAGTTSIEVEVKPIEHTIARAVRRAGEQPAIRHSRFGSRDGEQPQLPAADRTEVIDAEIVDDEKFDDIRDELNRRAHTLERPVHVNSSDTPPKRVADALGLTRPGGSRRTPTQMGN